jgi:hypothetical protein
MRAEPLTGDVCPGGSRAGDLDSGHERARLAAAQPRQLRHEHEVTGAHECRRLNGDADLRDA